MRRLIVTLTGIGLLFAVAGCVGKSKYDEKVEELENTKQELAKTKKKAAETESKLKSRISTLEDRISKLEEEKAKLEKELKKKKETLQLYESETGSLEEKLNATKQELDKLREQQAEQRERLKRYRKLAKRLADMFKSDQLSVKTRDGKMVIEMRDDVLFDSGRAKVNESGREVLDQLASVLQDIDKREFLVAGHTDNVPISSSRFEDNWDLSTSRATNVVRLLADKGVPSENLGAAGFSKYDPIASNETDEGKAKNRRIEIVMMPRVDELPNMPDDLTEETDGSS